MPYMQRAFYGFTPSHHSFAEATTMRSESGSRLMSAERYALACSKLMCGGSGGTFGVSHHLDKHRPVGGERALPPGSWVPASITAAVAREENIYDGAASARRQAAAGALIAPVLPERKPAYARCGPSAA
jgi:hypothetical protein